MKIRVLLFLLVGLMLGSCKTTFKLKDGSHAYRLNRFSTATEMLAADYSKASDANDKQALAEKTADAYKSFSNYSKAEEWYKKALENGNSSNIMFKLGLVQKMQEKYDEAIKTFEAYQKTSAGGFEGKKQVEQCRKAIDWMKENSKFRAYNESGFNTPQSDYGILFFKNQFVLTSDRSGATGNVKNEWNGQTQTDLFLVQSNQISTFSPIINTAMAEGQACFSSDFKEIYFTRCNISETNNEACHIYYSQFQNDVWSEAMKLELMDDSINVGDPCLSKDGKTLYFVARSPSGFGETDIYYSEKGAGGWSMPRNPGTTINSIYSERFPSIDEKGTLYFSSDGWPGMGGLDIFKTSKLGNGWAAPINLRSPFNSAADDFNILLIKSKPINENDTVLKSYYVSSNRKGGVGTDDIWRIDEIWKNEFLLSGKTIQKNYNNPENPDAGFNGLTFLPKARIELKNNKGEVLKTVTSDTTGYFSFTIDPETDYQLLVTKNGYFSNTGNVSTKGKKNRDSTIITIYTEVELEKIFTTKEIVIPNIYYDYDKATLRPESMIVLDSLMSFFKQNPDLTIEIGSHTDSRGSDKYNEKLSQGRAQSVVDYMVTKGIPVDKLQAKGYGESKLTNNCGNDANCDEEEHQKNRRTTFRVVSQKLNLDSIEPENITIDPK